MTDKYINKLKLDVFLSKGVPLTPTNQIEKVKRELK